MNLRTQCCKDCQKRHSKCHATCEEYIAAKAEMEKIKKVIAEQGSVTGYFADTYRKRKKRYLKK